MYYLCTTLAIERQTTHIFIIDSRKLPCQTFPHRTLNRQTNLQHTLPGPDIYLMDTYPSRQIREGHYLNQTHPRRTLARPETLPTDIPTARKMPEEYFFNQAHFQRALFWRDKCPRDISLTTCISQRTFFWSVKYLKETFVDTATNALQIEFIFKEV